MNTGYSVGARKGRSVFINAAAILLSLSSWIAAAQSAPATTAREAVDEAQAPQTEIVSDAAATETDLLAPADEAGQGAAKPTVSFSALPDHLSPWAMFLGADAVVKTVMILLLMASVLTWTVWLAKSLELRKVRARLTAAMPGLDEATNLADAASRTESVIATMVGAARKELAHFPAPYGSTVSMGIKERIGARLERIEAAAAKRIRRGVTVLASIGATAPFVGLFGTVWGIMNSFVGIAEAQTTNLAVVAPGIAEALLATALGLVAAIPAVLIFNSFTRGIAGYKVLVADAATLVMCIVSRELDRQALDVREPARVDAEPRRAAAVK